MDLFDFRASGLNPYDFCEIDDSQIKEKINEFDENLIQEKNKDDIFKKSTVSF